MDFKLDHLVMYAADPAITGNFHRVLLGALGFRKRRDFVFERDGLFVDIRQATETGEPYRRGRRGVDHLGFRAASTDQLDSIQATLRAAGLEMGRIIDFDNGDRALFVPDPDGLRIEVTCYADPRADPVD